MTANMNTKTPRELLAQCVEQLSADGHHELSLEIAALKAAQPVEPPPESAVSVRTISDGKNGVHFVTIETPITQPAPAAPYQVTAEDANAMLEIYYGTGGAVFSKEALADMRRALEQYEARKATA